MLKQGQIWVSEDGCVELEILRDSETVRADVKITKGGYRWTTGEVITGFNVTGAGQISKFYLKEQQMNNLEELQKRYDELGAEIAKLKEVEKAKNWPSSGDQYYYIEGGASVTYGYWEDDAYDKGAKSIGNMFRTKEEAEKELEARKVIAELRAQPGRKKFVIDQSNYAIVVNLKTNDVLVKVNSVYNEGWHSIYFESLQAAGDAIKVVGKERILQAARWLAMGE